jgi:rod shape-determining protein MreC
VVPIFTYRDERKLFAVIGTVIVAALIALVQLDALRNGKPSAISLGVDSAALFLQSAVTTVVSVAGEAGETVADIPRLYGENKRLIERNRTLTAQNARLREALSLLPDALALERAAAPEPTAIKATTIGYDPESQSRVVTIDRGTRAGIRREDGVVGADGIVGRVIEAEPLTSKVLLIIDGSSKVPAVVQRGRWWGIAAGTSSRVQLQYVSQDARLRVGDVVVTGEGRSFRAGLVVGRISQVYHAEGALYQTALVEPAVAFGRLGRVLVVPRSVPSPK